MSNPYDLQQMQRLIKADFEKLKNCKTKAEMNEHLANRIIIVQKKKGWENERCVFVEMVGKEKRDTWKMKVKTRYGTFLELAPNEGMITVQTIALASEKEADNLKQHLENQLKP